MVSSKIPTIKVRKRSELGDALVNRAIRAGDWRTEAYMERAAITYSALQMYEQATRCFDGNHPYVEDCKIL